MNLNTEQKHTKKEILKKEYVKPQIIQYANLVDITGKYQRQPCKTSSC